MTQEGGFIGRAGSGESPEAPAIYVSSGSGFSDATYWWYDEVLMPALRDDGFEPLDPWRDRGRATEETLSESDEASRSAMERWETCIAIAQRNIELLQSADAVLALLDGADVDSGVACEVGWAAALGIPIVGLRTDRRHSSDNDGSRVNLQVQYSVLLGSGQADGRMATDLDEALHDLAAVVEGGT